MAETCTKRVAVRPRVGGRSFQAHGRVGAKPWGGNEHAYTKRREGVVGTGTQ